MKILTTIFKEENRKDKKKTFLSFLSNYVTVTALTGYIHLYHTLIKCEDNYLM